ncbi:MAG: O-antigen ligase family protein [Candidatus Rokubacteria bacterium]|nr:O-antigen ligase family protein [Candidatus Rokubacteria bacterium]
MWILLAMILIMPLEKNPRLQLSGDITVIKVLGMIGLIWALGLVVAGRAKLELLDSTQTKVLVLYVGTMLFASILSGVQPRPLTAEEQLLQAAEARLGHGGAVADQWLPLKRFVHVLAFLPLTLVAVRRERDLLLALKTVVLTMMFLLPYGYRQMYKYGGRFGVGLYEPNYLGLVLVLLVPIAFVLAREARVGWKRAMWYTAMVVMLLEIVMTASRGALVAIMAVLPLLALRFMRRPVLVIGGAVAFVVLLILSPTDLGKRLRVGWLEQREGPEMTISGKEEVEVATGVQVSNETRISLLFAGIRMIASYPVSGVGLGQFKPSSVAYGANLPHIAHNTYLELGAEAGLPALGAFVWFFGATFASLRRTSRLAEAAGRPDLANLATAIRSGLTGYLVDALFLSAQYEKYLWLVIYLSVCLGRIVGRLPKRADPPPEAAITRPQRQRFAWNAW